jgi:DNA-binding CsgD family transcriptional regulator/PAS domain-containing protein
MGDAMGEDERVSLLIGRIYDAALDPALWPHALGGVRDFVMGRAAGLIWKDAVTRSSNALFMDDGGGMDPGYVQLYVDKYIKLDPFTTFQFLAEVETPLATVDYHLPFDEFAETRFYKEWAQPQGLVDTICTVLEKSSTSFAMYTVFRDERHGLVDAGARRRARLIAPHLRRAVVISQVLDSKTAEAATLADTFDSLRAGMVLVGPQGRIVHANASAYAMLAEGGVLRAAGGKLACTHVEAEQALHDVFLAAGCGDAAVGTKGIAIPLAAGSDKRYVAHVLPLTSGRRRRAGTSYAAVAAVFIHKAALATPTPPEVVAKTFKLTPSELRVLLAIVEVGGVPETAEALGIAETTVKTHLHRLFAKTGTHRQADLAKLVASFSSPLVG